MLLRERNRLIVDDTSFESVDYLIYKYILPTAAGASPAGRAPDGVKRKRKPGSRERAGRFVGLSRKLGVAQGAFRE